MIFLKLLITSLILTSCSTGFLKYNGAKSITKNVDFEEKVKIKSTDPTDAEVKIEKSTKTPSATDKETLNPASVAEGIVETLPAEKKKHKAVPAKKISKKMKSLSKKSTKSTSMDTQDGVRQPTLEDHVGFEGARRRPIHIPFRVGETVIHSVRYFSAEAGVLTLKIKPFVEVNNRKSYNFLTDLKTSGLFSNFYSVDDQVETYVDYEDLVPHVFKLHIKESAQLKEGQSFFDQKTLKATYWEHKYTEKNGDEEKKQEWDILPFSQNAFSGIFYMRIFAWEIGKEYSFRVSDNQKNILFNAVAVKKEKLVTAAGEFNAIQVKANVVSRGALTQAGDILFWLSDDERKYILRIEAKIKIGTLVSEVIQILPGSQE